MGRPGWFIGLHRERLRLTSHELPPRPDEPALSTHTVTRGLLVETPPGPATIGSAIAEVCAVFDAVLAGTWRWLDELHQALESDPSRPMPPDALVGVVAILKRSLVGEKLKDETWNRTWSPCLQILERVVGERSWSGDEECLHSFLKHWAPNNHARQMLFDRARRVWKQAKRLWPESLSELRGSGKAAASPDGVRGFSDEELEELRRRIQRSQRLTPADLVAWDVLIVFGLRPAELQGLQLPGEGKMLLAKVRRWPWLRDTSHPAG